ncbi:MAG: hypothetical protein EAZ89_10705 [Bacteroidetes bacterium]|nr:MAG: hypothetical protein EAZ89_10705 [Bacteroidota bacterium]
MLLNIPQTPEWQQLYAEVSARVNAVANDPEGRIEMRKHFYEHFGYPMTEDSSGLGNSELAFMRWEVERGVLNPPDHPEQPGSPWWREVNLSFLLYSELAGAAHLAGIDRETLTGPIGFWMDYIHEPNHATWYLAHNASIVHSYAEHAELSLQENETERHFLNEVLYRLIFAQAMSSGQKGAFGRLGKILANPRLPSVDIIVSLPAFYPRHYPLAPGDLENVRHNGHTLEEAGVIILDKLLILPQLERLFTWAARTMDSQHLPQWVKNDQPVYPNIKARSMGEIVMQSAPVRSFQWIMSRLGV